MSARREEVEEVGRARELGELGVELGRDDDGAAEGGVDFADELPHLR